jgi:hypothetical protein
MYPPPPSAHLDKEGRGIPAEQVFTVCTEDGAVVPTNLLVIDEIGRQSDDEAEASLQAFGFPEGMQILFAVALAHEWAYPPPHLIEMFKVFQERMRAFRGDDAPSAPEA